MDPSRPEGKDPPFRSQRRADSRRPRHDDARADPVRRVGEVAAVDGGTQGVVPPG